ncbi:PREDICTED: cytochrome P450 705A5-like [Tarenaya hassleriana]|uniref:cytochrome P450 705A5-like n=1 Tax=Tarenaya hassleriana TaxID=28532 RepID=UPI00053C9900|nr:PREDICTED: cytochrome P450 705A5-like [Tarenaya hassleriana]
MAGTSLDLQFILVSLLVWLLSVFFLVPFFFKKPQKSNVRLPPSPPALPIIGHLHFLISFPWFKSLQKLSSKYGPLLRLHAFGSSFIVVSSASMAFDVYRTQDVNFSFRQNYVIEDSIMFGRYSFMAAPYGDYFKFMKKLLVTKLLGQQHLQRSRGLRDEELERFYVELSDKATRKEVIDVHREISKLANRIICRMMMGRKCSEENGEADEIQDLVLESLRLLKNVAIATALRSLKRFGVTSWFEKEAKNISRRYDVFLDKILKEHEENPNKERKDITDLLLEAYHDENAEYRLTKKHIKSFLVELFLGGTSTTAAAVQWTMSEIINHPSILHKMREEIECVVGKGRLIQETDLPSLPYLQAVVKEGLRLHPPGALLPRICEESCKIGGFDVLGRTTLLTNVYAIMRDPDLWEDPEGFCPERFLASAAKGPEDNNKEHAMNFLPFGSGRRGCPGTSLAYVSMGMAVGTMAYYFDWEIDGDKVNVEETGTMTKDMAHPLKCTPVVRFNPLASIP